MLSNEDRKQKATSVAEPERKTVRRKQDKAIPGDWIPAESIA
jgi:hypothetical protein